MPLPTRILDLGDHKAANIRLFVPDKGTVGKYAALSYCWGPSNHFFHTAATVEDLKKGFDVGKLPRTLQDSVEVSRQIGLRYLWVDALCITQGKDSEAINDWNAEVGKMGAVYSKAYVTIAAAAAQDSSGGLFGGSYCDLPFLRRQTSEGHGEVVLGSHQVVERCPELQIRTSQQPSLGLARGPFIHPGLILRFVWLAVEVQ